MDPNEIFLKALEAAGWKRDEAVKQLEFLKAKNGWAEVPLNAAIAFISDNITAENIRQIVKGVASALKSLVDTGRGPVERDDSALG